MSITSKQSLYSLRNAIVNDDVTAIVEITGCPADKAELLHDAVKLATGNTNLIRARSVRTDDSIFVRKWEHTPTRTIRVPVCFADDILRFAHDLDLDTDIYSELEAIVAKHKAKARGYTSNNATEFIADVKALLPNSTE